jgi:apolipoprotein N-acyltransferase
MPELSKRAVLASFLRFFALVILSAVLFALSFPSLLVENGLPLLAWAAYIPLFYVIAREKPGVCVFWGALFGCTAYALFNYWLGTFHPLAGLLVDTIYIVYFAILFPLLRLAVALLPRYGFILQWLLWIGFEYLRTQGFLGYSYGITGYSQWRLLPLIQIASITGVWGVSALVVFPQAYIGALLGKRQPLTKPRLVIAGAYLAVLAATLVYGLASPLDYTGGKTARIALIQHNTDPWKGGIAEYRRNLEILRRLSREALEQDPPPELIVWSETAFVPRIYWHVTYRDDQEYYVLVKELLDFLDTQDIPYLIGNDDARREINAQGQRIRVDYNAAMLFEKNAATRKTETHTLYRKLHLVPFTEHFPYEKQFPWIYAALEKADTHFWEKGDAETVFEVNGLKFSTPICFEDTFGYLSRNFVRNGAELIVNISNDAWSASLPAQNQHLAMGVFRAVENRRSVVRSTASGQTCAIDPNGKILAMAAPFTEAALNVEVPVITAEAADTFYTRHGDYLPKIILLLAGAALIIAVVTYIIGLWTREKRF